MLILILTGVVCVAFACKVEPIVGKLSLAISKDLQAAQQRLQLLRLQLQTTRSQAQQPLPETLQTEKRPFHATTTAIGQLPAHLGWESSAVTLSLRQSSSNATYSPTVQANYAASNVETAVSPPHPKPPKTIKVYPDVAIGLLRQEQVAAGRLWLLLRVIDNQHRGWVDEAEARKLLTGKRSALRFCGPRQLRNLLAKGEAIFWVRQDGRIWLRSVAKVAYALGIPQLKLRPVAVPVRMLSQTIGSVRAHLYATFHSARTKANQASNPIARATVAKLTEVQPRTQRRYERTARVQRQPQFAVGNRVTVETQQTCAWQQGCASFKFKDFKGKQGEAGSSYVAWQLPNSYVGPHAQRPRGRQKRINRALTDLFMKGMTGNGQGSQVEVTPQKVVARRFFGNGRLAAKSYLRTPEHDHYWRGRGNGRYQLWLVMAGSESK